MEDVTKSELIKISFEVENLTALPSSLPISNEESDVSDFSVNSSIVDFCEKQFKKTIDKANELISQQMNVEVGKTDVASYNKAKELFYKHRSLWTQVKKDTVLIKRNLKPILHKVQFFSDSIYNPLQNSGKKLKDKMLIYEAEQERLLQEKKDRELAQQKREKELATMLLQFNTDYLKKINDCTTLEEIDTLKTEISKFDVTIFDEQVITATFQIAQLISTADMMRSNISMKLQNEELLKTEQERLDDKRRREDEELIAYQEQITKKIKEEQEELERERNKKLEILKKIKEDEQLKITSTPEPTYTGTNVFNDDFIFDEINIGTNLDVEINKNPICPTSKIDVEEDEKQSVFDKKRYNETLKELFYQELNWYNKNYIQLNLTQESLSISLAMIVEKNKNII
jgi:hypothetical protein